MHLRCLLIDLINVYKQHDAELSKLYLLTFKEV